MSSNRTEHSHFLLLFVFSVFLLPFSATHESRLPAASPPSLSPKITGDPETLKTLEQLKANQRSSLPMSGSFVLETRYLAPTQQVQFKGTKYDIVPAKPGKRIVSTDWAIQDDKIRFSRHETDEKEAPVGQRYIAAWDGSKGQMFSPTAHLANLYADKSKMLDEFRTRDPRGFSLFNRTIAATIDSEGGDFSQRLEQKAGSTLVVLTQRSKYRTLEYWLDPANGLIPRRIVAYAKNDVSVVLSDTIIHNHTRRPDNSWFITESTTTFPKENKEVRFQTNKVAFEKMPPDFFNIDIPDNTLVRDTASGLQFVAGGDVPPATDVDSIIEQSFVSIRSDPTTRPRAGSVTAETAFQTEPEREPQNQSHSSPKTSLDDIGPKELPVVYRTPTLYISVAAFSATLLLLFSCLIWHRRRYNPNNNRL